MDNLQPCFICDGKVDLFKEDGEYVVRCSVKGCGLVLDRLGDVQRGAVRYYNLVANAPWAQQ